MYSDTWGNSDVVVSVSVTAAMLAVYCLQQYSVVNACKLLCVELHQERYSVCKPTQISAS